MNESQPWEFYRAFDLGDMRARRITRLWLGALLLGLGCGRQERAVARETPSWVASTVITASAASAAKELDHPSRVKQGMGIPVLPASGSGFMAIGQGFWSFRDERMDTEGRSTEWVVLRLDLTQHRLSVLALGTRPFWELSRDPKLTLAVNGGFFHPDLAPAGLLVSEGVELGAKRRGGGSGILVVVGSEARLLKREEAVPREAALAIQCGPRLIEAGGAVGIRSDDGKRAARTAACIRKNGRELNFVVALTKNGLGEGPGLLQFANWLKAPLAPRESSGCQAALNLDGGPSTGVLVSGAPELSRRPLGPVPFALVATRRNAAK